MAKKLQKQDNQKEGVFSEFVENITMPIGILGFVAGFAVLGYGISFVTDPEETLRKTKAVVSGMKDVFSSAATVTLPDCSTETSKTVVSDGKTYTLTCTPH